MNASELARWAGRTITPGVRVISIESQDDVRRRCTVFRVYFEYPGGSDSVACDLSDCVIYGADALDLNFEAVAGMILDKLNKNPLPLPGARGERG